MGKKESIGKMVLLVLEKSIDGCVRLEDFAEHHYRYHYGIPELKKSSLSQAIKRLREKGFVEKNVEKDEGQIILKLTEAGKEFILLSRPEEEIIWDGKWRIVIFDVPENKRAVRDVLRSRLKLWDFKPWQKSVWASRKNVTNKLRNLIKDLAIEDWVLVIESDNAGR